MKNIVLSLLLLCLFCSNIYAQKASVFNGQVNPKQPFTTYSYCAAKGNNILQACFISGRSNYVPRLIRYNKKLALSEQKDLPALNDNAVPSKLVTIDGQQGYFVIENNKNDRNCYFQVINVESLEHADKRQLVTLAAPDYKHIKTHWEFRMLLPNAVFGEEYVTRQMFCDVFFSADSSKLAVIATEPSGGSEAFHICVFDKKLNKIWEKQIAAEGSNEELKLLNITLTNDGDVITIGKVFAGGKKLSESADGKPNYNPIVCIYSNSGTVKKYPLKLDGKYLNSGTIIETSPGEFQLLGLLQGDDDGDIDGYFTTKISLGNMSSPDLNTFSAELLKRLKEDDQLSKKGDGIGNYFYLKSALYDGTVCHYLLEYDKRLLYETSFTTAALRQGQSYLFGDIIDLQIKDGKSLRQVRIPKFQGMADSDFTLGFNAAVRNGKLILFYNDNEKNLSISPDEKTSFSMLSARANILTLTVVDGKKITRQPLRNVNDVGNSFPMIRFGNWIDADHLLFAANGVRVFGIITPITPGAIELK